VQPASVSIEEILAQVVHAIRTDTEEGQLRRRRTPAAYGAQSGKRIFDRCPIDVNTQILILVG